jgi:glycosyltransferase involved in cell wall biosynthesis
MFSHFSGRIIQVLEALDQHDAVSNQVLELDRIFREQFRVRSEIYAAFFHPQTERFGRHIDLMETDERDILIYHYSGHAKHSADRVTSQSSIKILHYHNITPHEFFRVGSQLYRHCVEGRRQLADIFDHFDFFTGDSQFNIDEIISLGVPPERTQVLSIIVDTTMANSAIPQLATGNVLFVGRIAENKSQARLVEVYAHLVANGHQLGKLLLVGKYDPHSAFYRHLTDTVRKLNLRERVVITGQLESQDLQDEYSKAGLFLSMSEHEGFGVPLLEACRYNIPVLALARTAVPETLRQSPGLFDTEDELDHLVARIESEPSFREALLSHQRSILATYDGKVQDQLNRLLTRIIPQPDMCRSVSIIICTYNRGELLERALDYLQRQHDRRFEVIVVNGPSTDNTAEVIRRWRDRIKFAENPQRNLSISRNIGIRLAAGDIVAFIDDDALPFDDWVSTLLAEYNSVPRQVGGVGGVTYYAGSLEFQADDIVIDSYGRSKSNPSREDTLDAQRFRTLLGTNSSFRRDVLLEIGGFDEEYDYFLDESDVCLRVLKAGYRLLHSRQLFVRHEFAQSDNRIDKYRYNWYSICKNTTYFALRFNTGDRNNILARIRGQIESDRITHLKQGLLAGLIDQSAFDNMSDAIWRGVKDGIRDAEGQRRILNDSDAPPPFHPFLLQTRTFTPLHILLVTKEFPPFTPSGGVGTLYYHLASELLLMGHRVSVIAQGLENSVHRRGRFTLYRIPQISTINFGTGSVIAENNLNWSMLVAEKILEIHRYEPIAVLDTSVWDTECYAFAVYRPRVQIPMVVRLVTPFAVACESNDWRVSEFERKLVIELERELVAMADCVVPLSRSIEHTFKQHYRIESDSRWHRMPAGIAYWPSHNVDQGYADVAHWPKLAVAKENGKFIFLFLSRLEIRKGVDILLDAVQRFVTRYPARDDYLFVLAGRDCMGVDRYLRDHVDRRARNRLLLVGEVTVEDREKLYSAADVVVFPSRYESFGLVALEAFVHGKPVIGADAGAIPEVVEHDRSGLIFEDANSDALSDCFDRLLNDRPYYQRLARGGKQRVRELSSAKMGQETEVLYRSMLQ